MLYAAHLLDTEDMFVFSQDILYNYYKYMETFAFCCLSIYNSEF